ncbi:isochorismate synthase [Umezawaea sp. Da 62-37]|uniref:isochorismate synthase n=1 Tax=Umezawaea sp. Da 62-37 TaxID=3075927 RepID=UPI0028F6F592|nr:isochorismate synthase [Umezawaea sp. Da 62-37]WNV87995.1 isochorismate synthase [Umezawaea sp. Da 62-37]
MTIATRTTTSADQLVTAYRDGAFFLSTPRGAMLVPDFDGDLASAPAAVSALADAGRSAVLVGALPFDPATPARLGVSRAVSRTQPWRGAVARPGGGPRWTGRVDHAEVYRSAVRQAIARLAGPLDKVVLARVLDLATDQPVECGAVLRALAAGDPRSHVFATGTGNGTLLGASPELLVSRVDGRVLANPLAGSARRDPDPSRDAENRAALSASAKDRREHAFVVEAVADGLAPLCSALDVPREPELLATRTMWHLSTRVTGVARDGVSALDLALALHPTPAVCGSPTHLARRVIGELEPFDRGYYTGLVGWTDAEGDGEWVVAIRCAEVADRSVRLFAGAGIVHGSTPEGEVAETDAKFRTVLHALGIDDLAT